MLNNLCLLIKRNTGWSFDKWFRWDNLLTIRVLCWLTIWIVVLLSWRWWWWYWKLIKIAVSCGMLLLFWIILLSLCYWLVIRVFVISPTAATSTQLIFFLFIPDILSSWALSTLSQPMLLTHFEKLLLLLDATAD